jgi:hypothetical protein
MLFMDKRGSEHQTGTEGKKQQGKIGIEGQKGSSEFNIYNRFH